LNFKGPFLLFIVGEEWAETSLSQGVPFRIILLLLLLNRFLFIRVPLAETPHSNPREVIGGRIERVGYFCMGMMRGQRSGEVGLLTLVISLLSPLEETMDE